MHGALASARLADEPLVDRHVAPPQPPLALRLDRLLDQQLELGTALGLGRQEADADPVAPGSGQLDAGGGGPEEGVRDLEQQARAVARIRVRALGAAMFEVLERVERLLDDGVGRLAPELGDERDAAGVVLICGVVEASGRGCGGSGFHRSRRRRKAARAGPQVVAH